MAKKNKQKNTPQQVTVTKETFTRENAQTLDYPDSKEPGVHGDSAPIGG